MKEWLGDCIPRGFQILYHAVRNLFDALLIAFVDHAAYVTRQGNGACVQAANARSPELPNEVAKLEDDVWTSAKLLRSLGVRLKLLRREIGNLIGREQYESVANITVFLKFFNDRHAFVCLSMKDYGFQPDLVQEDLKISLGNFVASVDDENLLCSRLRR